MPWTRPAWVSALAASFCLLALVVSACSAPWPIAQRRPAQSTSVAGSSSSPTVARSTAASASASAPAGPGDSASAAPSGTPTAEPSTSPDRPEAAVPSVRPKGFVDPPAGHGIQRYLDQPVRWSSSCSANGQVMCAAVSVPLDWSKPDGQAITLVMDKVAATRQPRLGTLFVNPGGPGGSGVQFAAAFAGSGHHGLEQYDIVGWDPRGVGFSTPVACETGAALDRFYAIDDSPDTPAEDTALQRATRDFDDSCLQHSGALLEHISTLDTVKDLDFLRQLVGSQKLNYLGFSYGTLIGAVYANAYPDRVGRMVLDGAMNITGKTDVTQDDSIVRALAAFADWCAGRDCPLGRSGRQVLDSIADLLDRLDGHPLAVGDRQLTQALAMTGIIEPLYGGQSEYQDLLDALDQARSGDGTALLREADDYYQRHSDGSYDLLITSFDAISCLDDSDTGLAGARRAAAATAKADPPVGRFLGVDYTCALWPVPPAPALPKLVARGAAPIVVISTTGDPVTPYEDGVGMAEQLDSGVLITHKGTGHTVFHFGGDSCVDSAVDGYLVDGTVPKDGLTCG